jgi:hypothetical protein
MSQLTGIGFISLRAGVGENFVRMCIKKVAEEEEVTQKQVVEILYDHYSLSGTRKEVEVLSLLEQLPPELVQIFVMDNLSFKEAIYLCATSKTLSKICKDDEFWRRMTEKVTGSKEELDKEIVQLYAKHKRLQIDRSGVLDIKKASDFKYVIDPWAYAMKNGRYKEAAVIRTILEKRIQGETLDFRFHDFLTLEGRKLNDLVRTNDWDALTLYCTSCMYASFRIGLEGCRNKGGNNTSSVSINLLMRTFLVRRIDVYRKINEWLLRVYIPTFLEELDNCISHKLGIKGEETTKQYKHQEIQKLVENLLSNNRIYCNFSNKSQPEANKISAEFVKEVNKLL